VLRVFLQRLNKTAQNSNFSQKAVRKAAFLFQKNTIFEAEKFEKCC